MRALEAMAHAARILNGCDFCGKRNPDAEWSNVCPRCREAYNRRVTAERDRAKRQADEAWQSRPQ